VRENEKGKKLENEEEGTVVSVVRKKKRRRMCRSLCV